LAVDRSATGNPGGIAIIAGNPAEELVAKLRSFWEGITTNPPFDWTAAADRFSSKGYIAHGFFDQMSAVSALVGGARRFFTLRQPGPWLQLAGCSSSSTDAGLSATRRSLSPLLSIQQSLYWHDRCGALVLDQDHQEFRRLGIACVPVDDVNIVGAF
jgi:hypothetical protein